MIQQRVDKHLISQRFLKSMESYDLNASVQKQMAKCLIDKFLRKCETDSFDKAFEIGCGTGLLTKAILERIKIKNYFLNDIVYECSKLVKSLTEEFSNINFQFIHSDAEELDNLPDTFDLMLSNAAFQWFNDLDLFFKKLHNHLTQNGNLVFSTFGKNNLYEINAIEKKSLHYYNFDDIISLTEKYFYIVDCSEENIELLFNSPKDVLNHLKYTGTKGLQREKWTKKHLEFFEDAYYNMFRKDDKVTLTFNPIYIIAKRK